MKLLFLCKRRPQGRDIFTQPFGRFYYLPKILSEYGHEGYILLLSYKNDPESIRHEKKLTFHTISAHPWGPAKYLIQVNQITRTFRPDWIIGFSDIWYGIWAERISRSLGINSLIDAYDNYESYIPWAKPLHWIWRFALKRSTALTAAGPELAMLMSKGREKKPATVIPMAADPIFQPISDNNLRKQLDLPSNVPLIGYCGSLYKNRGLGTMFQALEHLLEDFPNAKLVISGKREHGIDIPYNIQNAIISLGYLPDERMPLLLNALDVFLVINRDSVFGNFSYPVKLYEAMRCRRPVVASRTKSTSWILKDYPECLADPNNPADIAKCIKNALSWKTKEYSSSNYDWEYSASILNVLLEQEFV
ncbi:glycosyltransferase [Methylomonas rapida]|uniref:Glycosyltransferase n=1 Tax=Methylomonas rapida TaxID=2963939 RepID=A0ABY7GHV2_9GAMM|nr:glycosyltransferase [Methylomonas rapida]WAR44091.1 glycosyltransferase [Methylomonas rapida]